MPFQVYFTQQQQGILLNITFSLKRSESQYYYEQTLNPFHIDNLAEVWFNFKCDNPDNLKRFVLFRIAKDRSANNATAVKLNISCEALKYCQQFNCPEISTYWIDMGSFTVSNSHTYSLQVSISVSKIVPVVTFANLYHDCEVTDFRLTTAEGSVAVHKACLAAHSDVFRTMICGDWKEAEEAQVELRGTSLETLQHLKDYLYLGTLPDEGLHQLLLLAKYYKIENLKEECIVKIAEAITYQNLYSGLQFACENNVPELAFKVVQLTPSTVINCAHQLNKLKLGCNTDAACLTEMDKAVQTT